MNLSGKRVAIGGGGRSGLTAAALAKEHGADVMVLESNPDVVADLDVAWMKGWDGRLPKDAEFDLYVVSPGLPLAHPSLTDARTRGIEVIGEIELGYRLSNVPLLGVTGTNGKSTVTVLLWRLLQAAGAQATLCGNVAGSGYPEVPLCEAVRQADAEALACEISSFQLETVKDLRPKVATITNITPDHLDRHGSFENYRQTKLRLLQNMTADDTVVLNADDMSVSAADVRKMAPEVRLLTYSPHGDGQDGGSSWFLGNQLQLGRQKLPVAELPFAGGYFLANVMAAWEMANAYLKKPTDDQEQAMAQAIKEFKGLAHRTEFLGERNGVQFVNSSMCTNPSALVAVSRSIPRRQHLILGGNTKNVDFTPVAQYLGEAGHHTYLLGPDPDHLRDVLHVESLYDSLEHAVHEAAKRAREGEVVMLAPGCASTEPYRNFQERGDAFRKIVEEIL